MRKTIKPDPILENTDYLRGYRDGQRDRTATARSRSNDGILGALLALSLLAGVGYASYNYFMTGNWWPTGVELPRPQLNPTQPRL